TLEVPEGSLTALLGPSGSGKSTLLRIIAGLETPDAGTISIAASDVTGARPQDRGVGFVFQHYAAFAHMSVYENVAFGLRIRKRDRAEIRSRVDELLALEVADTIAGVNEGRIEQVGSPREVYDKPATDFVMGFLGPVSRLNGQLVRPHDVTISLSPGPNAIEAMVARVVHLGFEVRIELELPGGEAARAQLTRTQTAELELARGDIVYVRPPAEARAAITA